MLITWRARCTSDCGMPYTSRTAEDDLISCEPKETLKIQVEKDLIKIRNHEHFAGDWKKK